MMKAILLVGAGVVIGRMLAPDSPSAPTSPSTCPGGRGITFDDMIEQGDHFCTRLLPKLKRIQPYAATIEAMIR